MLSQECTADELLQSAIWETGPPWLTYHSQWPRWSPKGLAEDSVISASASTMGSHSKDKQLDIGSLQDLTDISRFKSYEHVLCTMLCILRFISNLKQATERTHASCKCPSVISSSIPVPTVFEISHAEVVLLCAHQIQHFRQEREHLLKKSKLDPPISTLSLNLSWPVNST